MTVRRRFLKSWPALPAILLLFIPAAAPRAVAAQLPTRTLEALQGLANSRFGRATVSADFNGDGYPDLAVGAPGDYTNCLNCGRVLVYFGGPGADASPDWILDGSGGESLGFALAAGDVNDDGYTDLIVGAPDNNGVGAVYVYYGGPTPDSVPDLFLAGVAAGDQFGWSVGSADLNGDGFADILVGAPNSNALGTASGQAYVYFGGSPPDNFPTSTLNGNPGSRLGYSVAGVGDVDGDGYGDFLVGAPTESIGAFQGGTAFLYYGKPGAVTVPELSLIGQDAGETLGIAVAAANDVNGDGYPDFMVGAPGALDATGTTAIGKVFVWYGGPGVTARPDLTLPGEVANTDFGDGVGAAGDVNGDGYADLIVGARLYGGSTGRAYVFFGGPGADTEPDLTFDGPPGGASQFAWQVGSAGDFDGDGYDDVVVGAEAEASGQSGGGAYVFAISPAKVLSPNGGEQWVAGARETVRWSGTGLANVELSEDGGATWAPLALNVGGKAENSLTVVAPAGATDFALVRATYVETTISPASRDASDAVFHIVPPWHPPAAAARVAWQPQGAAGGDELGYSVASAGDMNGDGYPDLIAGVPANDAAGTDAGAAYIYFGGPASDGVPDLVLTGAAAGDGFGFSVAGLGDVNGDGYADVVVGAPYNSYSATNSGRAYVYFGGPAPDNVPDLILSGVFADDRFGTAVAAAGDLNGDGYADIAVTEPSADFMGTNAGRVFVYFGGPAPNPVEDFVVDGVQPFEQLGTGPCVAHGDVNGDGYDDLIIGSSGWSSFVAAEEGRVQVFYGGRVLDAIADETIVGGGPGDNFGYAVSAGDVDGDGRADILVGAFGVNSYDGAAYLFTGPAASATDGLRIDGDQSYQVLGVSVSIVPDVNGDGYPDLLVGAPWNSAVGSQSGKAYLLYGGPGMDAQADRVFTGSAGDQLGWSVAGLGNVFGDGLFNDVAIGAPWNDVGGADAGRTYVYDFARYRLAAPNGGETWQVGAMTEIRWQGAEPADVWLSADGGVSYDLLEADVGGSESNSYALRVPHKPTKFARVRVTPHASNVSGGDASDSTFTVQVSVSLLSLLAAPAPDRGAVVTWRTDPGPSDLAGYRLDRADGGGGWRTVVGLTSDTTYTDLEAKPESSYRLFAVNGLGEELMLGEASFHPRAPLSAWPLPYRCQGSLSIAFATYGGLGGGVGPADVALFDVRGRLVRRLARGEYPAGYQAAVWDGRDEHGAPVPAGIYFLRSRSGAGGERSLKITVLR